MFSKAQDSYHIIQPQQCFQKLCPPQRSIHKSLEKFIIDKKLTTIKIYFISKHKKTVILLFTDKKY